jgi:tRNA (guanine9-N1)-methyltransferase
MSARKTVANAVGAALNKKQRKRQLMKEVWAIRKSNKKHRKASDKKDQAADAPQLNGEPSRGQIRRAKLKEEFLKRIERSPTVLIDLDFEEQLSDKEKNSLAQQIMYCYGMNKKTDRPVQMHLSSVRGVTETYLKKIPGFPESWVGVKADDKPYLTTFKDRRDSLVYLTADSPNVIDNLDNDKIYILGGIVDRNRLKNITKDKAAEQHIKTARFPLNKYCKMGVGSNVLTINHCFDILLARLASADWPSAFCRVIPTRKDLMLRDEYKDKYASLLGTFAAPKDCKPSRSGEETSGARPEGGATKLTAAVIGASSGIGLGFAKVLYKRGYDVLMVGRSAAKLGTASEEVRRGLETGGKVYTFVADCATKRDCYLLRDFVKASFGKGRGKLSCLVNSAGTFKWDKDVPAGEDPAEYLKASNYTTKQNVLQMLVPFLLRKNYSDLQNSDGKTFDDLPRVILVGSQAGQPNFVEEIEKREGKGAADGELGYINAMSALRTWAIRMKDSLGRKGIHIQLLEPGLIDTAMARKEFSHFGIDWSNIQKPVDFAKSAIDY